MKKPLGKPAKKEEVIYIARTTAEDREHAEFIGRALVESKTAVSVHIREITSIFQWEGAVDQMTEYEIVIICKEPEKAKEIVGKYHTYKLPEFIYVKLECFDDILKWCTTWCK